MREVCVCVCVCVCIEGHLGSFQLLAIINGAAMNIVEHKVPGLRDSQSELPPFQ